MITETEYIIPTMESEWNSRYLSNDPHFSFMVSISENEVWTHELRCWLLDHVGKNHEKWEWWWSTDYRFEFKNESDAIAFKLRWL